MKNKAVFFDRDGTLVEHVPYLFKPKQIQLTKNCREALVNLIEKNFLLFVLTNQSGVGRGFYELKDVVACNERMLDLLNLPVPGILEIKIAPEAPDAPSKYRKPSPAFLEEKIIQCNLDSALCYMVGDSIRDVETAFNAGVCPVFIHNPTLPEEEKLSSELKSKVLVYPDVFTWVQTLE